MVNDNGGTALNTAWTLTATGALAIPTNLSGSTPVDSGAGFKADTYALAETGGPATGYTAGAWNCGAATMPDVTHVTVPLGGNVTCTIINDDIPPRLIVNKVVVPGTDTGRFNLTITRTGFAHETTNQGDGGTTGEVILPIAGIYTAGETAYTGTDLADYVTMIGGACASNGTVTVGIGQVLTCTITNTRKALAKVTKTVSTLPPNGTDSFTFQLREGASVSAAGTTLESGTANAANGGIISFTSKLIPGQHYQLCEIVLPGWNNNFASLFTVFDAAVTTASSVPISPQAPANEGVRYRQHSASGRTRSDHRLLEELVLLQDFQRQPGPSAGSNPGVVPTASV